MRHLLVLLAVAAVVFFAGLGRLPLLEPDEGRNAEVAREMLVSGDWVTPRFNTLTYLDKPVVYFWLVAAAFRLAGVTEWAARFPSALMALATLLLTWFLARRMFGDSAGLRAGIILATCPLVMAFARLVIFDMTLVFLVTVAMVCFWLEQASDFRRPWLDVAMFASMGLATITKGPVGFLLPLLSVLAYQALRRRFGELKRLRWGLGLAVFLAVTLPWFIAVCIQNPDFARYAFWQESLLRFATGSARRGGSVLYYVPVYLLGFFPWSFFLLFAGGNRLKRWKELGQETHKALLFLLVWAGVIFVFFTISRSKLPAYFLPASVPLGILMAQVWAGVGAEEEGRRPDWLTAGFAALIGLGLLVAVAPQMFPFAAITTRLGEKLAPAFVTLLRPSILYSGLILVALGIVGRNLAARLRGKALAMATFTLLALTAPSLVVRWWVPLKVYAASSSSRQLAQTILKSPEKDLPLYGYYCFRTSLGFYLRRPVGLLTTDGGEMTSNYVSSRLRTRGLQAWRTDLRPHPKLGGPADGLLIDGQDLRARARPSSAPMLIMVRNRDVGELAQAVPQLEPLWNDWAYSIWKVPAGNK